MTLHYDFRAVHVCLPVACVHAMLLSREAALYPRPLARARQRTLFPFLHERACLRRPLDPPFARFTVPRLPLVCVTRRVETIATTAIVTVIGTETVIEIVTGPGPVVGQAVAVVAGAAALSVLAGTGHAAPHGTGHAAPLGTGIGKGRERGRGRGPGIGAPAGVEAGTGGGEGTYLPAKG